MSHINSMMFLKNSYLSVSCEKLNLVLTMSNRIFFGACTPRWSEIWKSNICILNSGAYLTGQIHTKLCQNTGL